MNKNDEKLVSIIVPVYNVEKYLKKCVLSIINQSYKKIEIILVDDGSKDKSGLICEELAKRDSRIKIIHKSNGGPSSTRKAGLEKALGEYVLFVDSDDWIDEETIQYLLKVAIINNSDCVCFSYIREYEGKSSIVSQNVSSKDIHRRLFGLINNELKYPQKMDSISSCCMKLYSIRCAREGEYFDAKLYANAEDTLFNIYALNKANNCIFEDKPFYHYRKYNAQSLTNLYRENLGEKLYKVFDVLKTFIDDNKLNDDYKNALQNRITLSVISFLLNEIGNPNFRKSIININGYLTDERYVKAVNTFNCKYISFPWRVIIYLCKKKKSIYLYFIFYLIKQLKKYR